MRITPKRQNQNPFIAVCELVMGGELAKHADNIRHVYCLHNWAGCMVTMIFMAATSQLNPSIVFNGSDK
ncbi:MAG: hypothetical protein EBY34_06915 [Alphaproteobacteria bacterium]|nr:hypothetical protein [Alphaproteobacteria bacterium]NDG37433.1 hypothetical protein [Alphaproteobacteria bacterium]